MKKFIFLIILGLIIPLQTQAIELSAKSAVLLDRNSGRILFSKNGDVKMPMASTTKIMTGLLACESKKMSKTVTVSPFASGTEGSSLWLEVGEKQTLENLTYGLLLRSGNDAAVAIAEFLGGSIDAFSLLMTARAKKAGAYNTSFKNPHGLDAEGHFTTAADLALISCSAMKNKSFAKIVATKNKSIPWESSEWDRVLKNHNKLLWRYDGCDGIKTGFTKKCGRCLVSSATRAELGFICVTLNAPDDWNDHEKLLNYGFENFKNETVCRKGDKSIIVQIDKKRKLQLLYNKSFSFAKAPDDTVRTETVCAKVSLPIKKGSSVASLHIYVNDIKCAEIPLISSKTVRKKNFF